MWAGGGWWDVGATGRGWVLSFYRQLLPRGSQPAIKVGMGGEEEVHAHKCTSPPSPAARPNYSTPLRIEGSSDVEKARQTRPWARLYNPLLVLFAQFYFSPMLVHWI